MRGRNGMDWPKEMQRPSSHVTASPASASARRHSSTSRDLPMPASPVMNTTWPRPALTSRKRSSSVVSSRSRPTNGVRPRSIGHVEAGPAAAGPEHFEGQDGARPSLHRHLPQSRVSKKPATSRE